MKLVLGVSVVLLLLGSGVWASLSVGSLSQNTDAWVAHSREPNRIQTLATFNCPECEYV